MNGHIGWRRPEPSGGALSPGAGVVGACVADGVITEGPDGTGTVVDHGGEDVPGAADGDPDA
ncbi:hypothetical protein [Streptomyces yanii]|uniref:Uncharacterized protein n=1 Tax=Streptomyces yanii TaxID=78510 RepID=A0ABV5RS47_9ACTN